MEDIKQGNGLGTQLLHFLEGILNTLVAQDKLFDFFFRFMGIDMLIVRSECFR